MSDVAMHLDADGILRPLTEAEIAEIPGPRPAQPRTVEGRLLIKVLTDDQAAQLKVRDLLRIAGDQAVPTDNGAVARVAGKLGLVVSAWFDAAVSAA